MANFKRRKTSRNVRCTICTSFKWMGNNNSEGYNGRRTRKGKAERNRISPTELD